MTKKKSPTLVVNALKINQRSDVPFFVFGVNGRLIKQFATVQHAHRVNNGKLKGYQREKVGRHIDEILDFLKQSDSFLPNAIVISFDKQIKFNALPGLVPSNWGTFGKLTIPYGGRKKPGFIVDGQQRTTALAQLNPNRNFPVVVTAFQSPNETVEREQFVLVNKTKPLPRDLLNELLPHVDTYLPKGMRLKKIAASVLQELRFNTDSPFSGRIIGLGAGGESCNISQNAVIEVVLNSLKQGVLSEFSGATIEETDVNSAAKVLALYFKGVQKVWPTAWEGSPKTSRLVHGVGIFAVGRLMDTVMETINIESTRALGSIRNRLGSIRDKCRWTSGRWPTLRCEWNELQNTSQDKNDSMNI